VERINAEELKDITRSELYAIFVETVMDSSDERLDAFTKSEVLDDVAVKKSRHKKCFSFFPFFKSGHWPHF